MAERDLASDLAWMRSGTALLVEHATGLSDSDIAGPSRLPDWSRGHVLGHLARNAEALTQLTQWAASGVETPMYANLEQRDADIATSALLPANRLRSEITSTVEVLDAALADLSPEQWLSQVRTALGREIPASGIPWMRVREVWLHALDLDAGVAPADFPSALVDALLDDITAALARKATCPAVRLIATDRERDWSLTVHEVEVSGSAADLLAWVSGRSAGQGLDTAGRLPLLPAWL